MLKQTAFYVVTYREASTPKIERMCRDMDGTPTRYTLANAKETAGFFRAQGAAVSIVPVHTL